MRQSRHKSVDTALSYLEAGDVWRNDITGRLLGHETATTGPIRPKFLSSQSRVTACSGRCEATVLHVGSNFAVFVFWHQNAAVPGPFGVVAFSA